MFKEFEHWEVLVRDQQRIGLRYRSLGSNVLVTRMLLDDGPEPYRVESRVRLDPVAGGWDLSWFRDRASGEARLMRREQQGFPANSMPSSADVLMLNSAIAAPGAPIRYWRLDEAAERAQVSAIGLPAEPNAYIQRVGKDEQFSIPLGDTVATDRFEAWADGLLVATHWVDERQETVCTKWGEDLLGFRMPGAAPDAGWLSLSGLDDRTVEFMTKGFDAFR